MSKAGGTLEDALEREARAAKANIEQLVQDLAALPAGARAAIRGRIDADRSRLESLAARIERELDDQRVDLEAELARLDGQLEGRVDELGRRRIEASKAEAEAAYETRRCALENAHAYAKDGIALSAESAGRYSRAFEIS